MSSIMELTNDIYLLEQAHSTPSSSSSSELLQSVISKITAEHMTPLYQALADKLSFPVDETLLSEMKSHNTKELESIAAKIEDAAKNAGDTEVIENMFTKARYLAKIGSNADALAVYDDILGRPKTVTGKKIDAHMEKARIHLITLDTKQLKASIDEAKKFNEIGGDWDRRNRLKIYEAHYLLLTRDVRAAASLLRDCIATFSCTELCSYRKFMLYAVITNLVSLGRNDLRKNIVLEPHVRTELRDLPACQALLQGIYQCQYGDFFEAILAVLPDIHNDRFLAPLANYLVREFRVLAYSQFLEAYKSVMMSSMASSFGISVDLLDSELSRFIASGRLNAKIDKVGDIVDTRRPDKKNAQYHEVIKKGDALLNQVQKLVRAIDM